MTLYLQPLPFAHSLKCQHGINDYYQLVFFDSVMCFKKCHPPEVEELKRQIYFPGFSPGYSWGMVFKTEFKRSKFDFPEFAPGNSWGKVQIVNSRVN